MWKCFEKCKGYPNVIVVDDDDDDDDGVTCQRMGMFFADLSCPLKVTGKVCHLELKPSKI